jgi:hypothetical protein
MSQKKARQLRQVEPEVPYQHTVNPHIHFTTQLFAIAFILMLVAIAVMAVVYQPGKIVSASKAESSSGAVNSQATMIGRKSGYVVLDTRDTIHEFRLDHPYSIKGTSVLIDFRSINEVYVVTGDQEQKLDNGGSPVTIEGIKLRIAGFQYYRYHFLDGKPADDNDVRVGIEVLKR